MKLDKNLMKSILNNNNKNITLSFLELQKKEILIILDLILNKDKTTIEKYKNTIEEAKFGDWISLECVNNFFNLAEQVVLKENNEAFRITIKSKASLTISQINYYIQYTTKKG